MSDKINPQKLKLVKRPKNGSITNPYYGCTVGAAYSVLGIKGGVPIANCGPGCMYKQFFMQSFDNGFQGSYGAGGGNLPSANVQENDVVFGGLKTLDNLIKSSLAVIKGDLYVVLTGCSGELIGDDVPSVVKKYRDKGYPIVCADTGGFKGTNLTGHEIVVQSIIDQFVGDYDGEKTPGLVNLWFETPYYNQNWRGDYEEIVRILRGAGLKVNILFGPENEGVKAWKKIPKAQFNLIISSWVGLETVEKLKEKYNQPYLHIPVLPIGEEATSAFVRKVVEYAGIDKKKSEKFIKREAELYYYYIEHFAEFFSEYWFGLPSEFAVIANSDYAIAYTKFLADQIGLIPKKTIVTDNPPEKYRAALAEEYKHLSDGVAIEPDFVEDGYTVQQILEKEVTFGPGVPLIIGTTWEIDYARDHGALLLESSSPTTESLVVNKSYIGYKGALSFIEHIYSATVGGK
ncbi:MAG: hydrogenase [Paludibacteraceae bacterium]|nr:hydrogenase [Paludibacteraceae bacterium]